MQGLRPRLRAIADLVPQGADVCDVGTDHGFLAAALVLEGRANRVTATDINEQPLCNARATFEKFGITDRVKLILCDGLSAVSRDVANTVIIAGMGGDVISGIISRADFLRDNTVTLILQPMTGADTLRTFLSREGFFVEGESAVSDNGKVYSVMVARFCGEPYTLNGIELRIGRLKPTTADNRIYIEKQLKICKKCAENMKNNAALAEKYNEMQALVASLTQILEEDNGV